MCVTLNSNSLSKQSSFLNILLDIEDTVDKFDLRKHVVASVECTGASWDEKAGTWAVHFRDVKTGLDFVRYAIIFVSAVGAISLPREIHFKGMERFKGRIVHTARWDHLVDYSGKRVVCLSCEYTLYITVVLD